MLASTSRKRAFLEMNLRVATQLIDDGESQHVEFKLKINHPDKVVREVVAFANAEGGHLFVGVDDEKGIVGVKHPEGEDFILQKAIKELCRPLVRYDTHRMKITEKRSLLHYYIYPGEKKPYYALRKKYHRRGKAYYRIEDRSVKASPEVRKILKFNNDPKDVQFTYGESEQLLFNYLKSNDRITLREFREISGLEYRDASNIVVCMVTANALRVIPGEGKDWYSAVEP